MPKIITGIVGYDPTILSAASNAIRGLFGSVRPTQTLVPVHRFAIDGMRLGVEAVLPLE